MHILGIYFNFYNKIAIIVFLIQHILFKFKLYRETYVSSLTINSNAPII